MKTGERIKGEDLKWKTLEVCEGGVLRIVEDELPKVGDEVWHVNQFGNTGYFIWEGNKENLFFVKYNRIFPTRELAEEYLEYLKKKAELSFEPDWGDTKQKKYHFWYNGENENKWGGDYTLGMRVGNILYFPNTDCMDELVESIGEEKFLYFEFGIPMEGEQK